MITFCVYYGAALLMLVVPIVMVLYDVLVSDAREGSR